MVFKKRDPHRWRYRFAFFPKSIGSHTIWFEKYAMRYVGFKRIDDALQRIEFVYELDHPGLGRFERRDWWIGGGLSFITGSWDLKLVAVK